MKICIIGGAGYIGSHVTRQFIDSGYRVVVFDNLSSGCRENIFDDETFIEGDILDYPALEKALADGCEGVVHLAAFKAAGESMTDPEKYALNNLSGTVNILNASAQAGIRAFVFSSSAAVYGEPRYVPVDEDHPLEPANFYGFTKLEIERLLSWYDTLRGLRYASLRYFNAAGYDVQGRIHGLEQNPANLLPVLMEVATGAREQLQIFGDDYDTPDGTCIRDYIHVNDLAAAHVAAFEYVHKNDRSLTLNLGSETGISVARMVEQARAILPRPIPTQITSRRAGDPASLVASSQQAREHLGWTPRCSDVQTLISSMWNVYRSRCCV